LSKPLGEKPSAKVAITAAATDGTIFPRTENGYNAEKKNKLNAKLEKLPRNMAAEPSRLLLATSLYRLLPYRSPINEAALSPYAIGKTPAAMT